MFIRILEERVLGEVYWWIREGGALYVTVFRFLLHGLLFSSWPFHVLECSRDNADKAMTDAGNAAQDSYAAGKAKASQAADAAKDYSKQAGDKASEAWGAAKDTTKQV